LSSGLKDKRKRPSIGVGLLVPTLEETATGEKNNCEKGRRLPSKEIGRRRKKCETSKTGLYAGSLGNERGKREKGRATPNIKGKKKGGGTGTTSRLLRQTSTRPSLEKRGRKKTSAGRRGKKGQHLQCCRDPRKKITKEKGKKRGPNQLPALGDKEKREPLYPPHGKKKKEETQHVNTLTLRPFPGDRGKEPTLVVSRGGKKKKEKKGGTSLSTSDGTNEKGKKKKSPIFQVRINRKGRDWC